MPAAYFAAAVMRNLITTSLATTSKAFQAPSPIEKSPRWMVRLPTNTPASPWGVKVAGTTTSLVVPLIVSLPATSYLSPPSALTAVDSKRALGKAGVLNQVLRAASSSPSALPVSW